MNSRVKKIILLLLAAACVFGSGRIQQSLNRDRDELGLTRTAVLENAPPALAFTTVALGGFRGLISNFLWVRANDLQKDDKFFEAAQLADWITKLEPTFTQVWLFQAWNMAYNISVKFKENAPYVYEDRWRWVERGIRLLRDDGLRYNPNSILIYRELGWFFQHKLGQNLDDGNNYYKAQWAAQMKDFFGPNGTNFDRLLNPRSAADYQTLGILTNRYKIDPVFAKSVDDQYGPFDWRLPEAHSAYWGAKGLDAAAKNPNLVKQDEIITLRRILYQSMLQAFHHGRMINNPLERDTTNRVYLIPNLELIPQVNKVYLESWTNEPDPSLKANILKAHRNFLRDAVYFLYVDNRVNEAASWFRYLGEKYPNIPIVENDNSTLPRNITLDEYAFDVLNIDINQTSQDRVTSAVMGYLAQSYEALITGQDDRYEGFQKLAKVVYNKYTKGTTGRSEIGKDRVVLPPWDELVNAVLSRLLDPQQGLPPEARTILRTQLHLAPETAVSTGATNMAPVVPELNTTNAADTNATAPVH